MLALIERCQNISVCCGLHSCRLVRVSMLTRVHQPQYRQWAHEHQNWSTEQWIRQSDEACFLLHHVDNWNGLCCWPGPTWHQDAPGSPADRVQCEDLGKVLSGNLGPTIHVDLWHIPPTLTLFLNMFTRSWEGCKQLQTGQPSYWSLDIKTTTLQVSATLQLSNIYLFIFNNPNSNSIISLVTILNWTVSLRCYKVTFDVIWHFINKAELNWFNQIISACLR